jgi:hypothetical protein
MLSLANDVRNGEWFPLHKPGHCYLKFRAVQWTVTTYEFRSSSKFHRSLFKSGKPTNEVNWYIQPILISHVTDVDEKSYHMSHITSLDTKIKREIRMNWSLIRLTLDTWKYNSNELTFDCCSQNLPIRLSFQSQFWKPPQSFWDWWLTGFLSILPLIFFVNKLWSSAWIVSVCGFFPLLLSRIRENTEERNFKTYKFRKRCFGSEKVLSS